MLAECGRFVAALAAGTDAELYLAERLLLELRDFMEARSGYELYPAQLRKVV
jgi:hypothetical protein